jgi:hypothetical protein
MTEAEHLIECWKRGRREPVTAACQNRPHIFRDAFKGPHPMRPLHREVLMEAHVLGDLWDSGKKPASPFFKLETWHAEISGCMTPAPITKFVFTVLFKKVIPWTERAFAFDGGVVCSEQALSPEDVHWIENGNDVSIGGADLQVFLEEYRRRKTK